MKKKKENKQQREKWRKKWKSNKVYNKKNNYEFEWDRRVCVYVWKWICRKRLAIYIYIL